MNKCVLFLHTTYYIYIPPFLFFGGVVVFYAVFLFCFCCFETVAGNGFLY